MSERAIPREVHIAYVIDRRTGGTHNVLEVCSKDRGVRFVMAQDSETAKERDKYKLRANLLEAENQRLREAVKEAGEAFEAASEGSGVNFHAYALDMKAALGEE